MDGGRGHNQAHQICHWIEFKQLEHNAQIDTIEPRIIDIAIPLLNLFIANFDDIVQKVDGAAPLVA